MRHLAGDQRAGPFAWAPRDGETVHLNPRNTWRLPAGRYWLQDQGRHLWRLYGPNTDKCALARTVQLTSAESDGILTPIGADELERERQEVALRTAAPLRGNRFGRMARQHDASELALFRSANEPAMI